MVQVNNVVNLYEHAQIHNATFLAEHCMWFMGVHFSKIVKRKEYKGLAIEDKEKIETKRWPPSEFVDSSNCSIQ